jgi:drug/metabolite transporter (DMT)-like permease
MSTLLVARLQLVAAALLFSTGGMAIKSCQLTSWQVASFRCLVAGLALVVLLPEARRRIPARAWLVGLSFALTLVLFALANKATTSANAIFLQAVAPLYLVPLAPLLLKEKVQRRDLGIMVLLAAGLALLLMGDDASSATAPAPARGNLLAAASGLTWACTVLGLRWLARPGQGGEPAGNPLSAVVAGNILGFLGTLAFALPVEQFRVVDGLWILYLGVFQIGLAYWLLSRGVAEVPAFEASLLLLAEPLFNPIWTVLVHGERPSAFALVGGFVILAATVLKTYLDLRAKPAALAAAAAHA